MFFPFDERQGCALDRPQVARFRLEQLPECCGFVDETPGLGDGPTSPLGPHIAPCTIRRILLLWVRGRGIHQMMTERVHKN